MGDFDYIVVGGGSSATWLPMTAVRLWVLLEVVSSDDLKIKVPLGYGSLFTIRSLTEI